MQLTPQELFSFCKLIANNAVKQNDKQKTREQSITKPDNGHTEYEQEVASKLKPGWKFVGKGPLNLDEPPLDYSIAGFLGSSWDYNGWAGDAELLYAVKIGSATHKKLFSLTPENIGQLNEAFHGLRLISSINFKMTEDIATAWNTLDMLCDSYGVQNKYKFSKNKFNEQAIQSLLPASQASSIEPC